MMKTDKIIGIFTTTIAKLDARAKQLDAKNVEITKKKVALQEKYVANNEEAQVARQYVDNIKRW